MSTFSCKITGIISFVLYSLSYLIGPEDETANHMLVFIKAGLIFLSALMFLVSSSAKADDQYRISFALFSVFILIYQIILLIAVGRTIIYIRDYPLILNSVMWLACSMAQIVRFRNDLRSFLKSLIRDIETVKLIVWSVLIAVIVILLSLEPEGVRFSWDSGTLFDFVNGCEYDSLFDAKQLLFSGHLSNIYVYLLVLFKLTFGSIKTAFFVLSSLCIVAASLGMIFLIRLVAPNKKTILYVFADAFFLFSPWVCGLSTYQIYDYYIWCLFPALVYYCSRKNWFGMFIVGLLISFSKSPGVIVFGGVCIGLLISDIISGCRIMDLIKDLKYWVFGSVALVFIVIYEFCTDIDTRYTDTKWGFDVAHTIHLLKIYLTANFLWIPVLLAVLLIINMYVIKKTDYSDDARRTVMILLVSDAVFVLFNIACITYHLPRYMDSHVTVVYICACMFIMNLSSDFIRVLSFLVLSIIGFIASFWSADPISRHLFKTINVGDRLIIDYEKTETPSFGDSIVYNREYYSYEVLLGRALGYVIDNKTGDDEVLFSLGNQDLTWGMSGGRYSYSFGEGRRYFDMFYDRSIGGLASGYSYEYYDSDEIVPFSMRFVFPEENVSSAVKSSGSDTFYYLYMPTINAAKEHEIQQEYTILSEKSFSYRGWIMNCIEFRR